jgi:hypothetical protein
MGTLHPRSISTRIGWRGVPATLHSTWRPGRRGEWCGVWSSGDLCSPAGVGLRGGVVWCGVVWLTCAARALGGAAGSELALDISTNGWWRWKGRCLAWWMACAPVSDDPPSLCIACCCDVMSRDVAATEGCALGWLAGTLRPKCTSQRSKWPSGSPISSPLGPRTPSRARYPGTASQRACPCPPFPPRVVRSQVRV